MNKRSRGSITVEFSLGFLTFWLMIMCWVEMSYLSYVNAISDLAIAEISRSSKRLSDDYGQHVIARITEDNVIWRNLVDKDNFRLSMRHYADIQTLFDDDFREECSPTEGEQIASCGQVKGGVITIYSLSYQMNTIFSYFVTDGMSIRREVMVVQEYERDQFDYSNG